MTLSQFLTTLTLTAALMSLAGETVGDAQIYRNTTVSDAPALPVGMDFTGNVYSFKLNGGAYAPMVVGFLSPPQIEPTLPSQHRAVWPFCEGPPDAVRCGWRVNYFGTILETSMGEWDTQ